MHGARTADDKVAPALLGTHSNWHGLESRSGQGERNDDLHGFGRAGIDGPSDGACMLQVVGQPEHWLRGGRDWRRAGPLESTSRRSGAARGTTARRAPPPKDAL